MASAVTHEPAYPDRRRRAEHPGDDGAAAAGRAGYDVSTATTAHAALDAVDRASRRELVILDLGLPDLDGIEVCRRMREGRAIPIIVLSARGAERDKVAALDAGADDYVTKPFGSDELLARVRAALRRADAGSSAAGPDHRGAISSSTSIAGV